MKLFRFGLNLWITVASIFSFMLGWAALAHAPKPVQPTQTSVVNAAPLPTLTPLQNLQFGSDTNNGFQNFQAPASSFNSAPAPIFRSSGS